MAINVYISGKADHQGREMARATSANEPERLRQLSEVLDSGLDIWRGWAKTQSGEMLTSHGDEFRLRIPAEALKELPQIKAQYADAIKATVSLGVGAKLTESDRALQVAQKQGGDKIKLYDPSVEEALQGLELSKNDYKSAAFKYGDRVYPTGSIHDIGELPVEIQDSPLEEGYVDSSGTFVPRPLKKADEPEPNSPAGGGGIVPPQEPSNEPAAPPEGEQGQAGPPPPQDMHQAFGQMATQQGQKDDAEQQQQQGEEQQQASGNDLKQQIVGVLKVLKSRAQELEAIQQQDPELYKSLVGMVQSMIAMARDQFASSSPKAEPVQKAEPTIPQNISNSAPWKKVDRPWLTASGRPSVLYANPAPKSGDITALEWLNDGALQVHFKPKPWELLRSASGANPIPVNNKELQQDYLQHTNLRSEEHEADQKHVMGGANLAKEALEAGLTGRHKVNYPVGTQIDGSASGNHDAGEIKIQDPVTGATKWREVRSGRVMGADGQPASSRHPQN